MRHITQNGQWKAETNHNYAQTNKYTHASPWHKSLYLHATLSDMFLQAATGTHTVPVHLMHLAVLPTWAFHSMPCRHVSRHNGKKFAYKTAKSYVSGNKKCTETQYDMTILFFHYYTPCFIKKTTPYLIAHNFGKCWLIFKKKIHPRTQQRSCNALINKGPITP